MIAIQQVLTGKQKRVFAQFPWRIYQRDPVWVPPLLPERMKAIDPRRGPFFKRGVAEFYIAYRDDRPVGTICCAEDRPTNTALGVNECLIGFFECIQDYAVAEALFDYACHWARSHFLNVLHGPFNLDYEDSYGVLLEGEDRPPVILCGHTPLYYKDFFEQYGFQPARGDNLAYAITRTDAAPAAEHISRLAERLRKRGRIYIRTADLDHWEGEVDRVHNLMLKALAHLKDYIPWPREALQAALEPFRRIVDPELVLFAEIDGQTVGWFPGIPNLNEALIHANGLRYPWDYLKLMWHARKPPHCLAIKSVLVLPEYWDTGVAVMLFDEMARRAFPKGYTWLDFSLTSADNPYTPALAERVGAKIYKRYRVYRLELDNQPR